MEGKMIQLYYSTKELNEYIRLNNPNIYQVVQVLKSRDEEITPYMSILFYEGEETNKPTKILGFNRARFDRFWVMFTDYNSNPHTVSLVDRNEKSSKAKIPIVETNGAKELIEIYYTITFGSAINVAIHFVKNGDIPEEMKR
jgi:hypothetical protein